VRQGDSVGLGAYLQSATFDIDGEVLYLSGQLVARLHAAVSELSLSRAKSAGAPAAGGRCA
jgi:hypothetical protein